MLVLTLQWKQVFKLLKTTQNKKKTKQCETLFFRGAFGSLNSSETTKEIYFLRGSFIIKAA